MINSLQLVICVRILSGMFDHCLVQSRGHLDSVRYLVSLSVSELYFLIVRHNLPVYHSISYLKHIYLCFIDQPVDDWRVVLKALMLSPDLNWLFVHNTPIEYNAKNEFSAFYTISNSRSIFPTGFIICTTFRLWTDDDYKL